MAEASTSKEEILNESDDAEHLCASCKRLDKQTTATLFCTTCNEFQCDSCGNAHKLFPAMSEHVLLDASDEKAGIPGYDMEGMDRCETHKKRIKYYCKTDDRLCCSTCAISSHLKCEVGEIESFLELNDSQKKLLEEDIQRCRIKSGMLITCASNLKQEKTKEKEAKVTEIEDVKTVVVKSFDSFKAKFISEADKEICGMFSELDQRSEKCKQTLTHLKDFEKSLKEVTEKGNSVQTFTVIHTLKSQIQNIIEDTHKSMTTIEMQVKFKEKLLPFLQANEEIATLSVTKQTVFLPVQLKLVASLDVRKSDGEKNEPLYAGLDFLEGGLIIAVDFENKKYVLFYLDLSVASQYTLNKIPLGVKVLSKNRVAISFNGKRVIIYNFTKDNSISVLHTFQTSESYDSLSCLDNETLVASTFDCDRPARMLKLSGEENDFDLPFPKKTYKIDECSSTYISNLNILVIADRNAHQCFLWNVKDKSLVVVKDKKLREPRGVCATSYGLLFICSSKTNSIVQISPLGKVLGSVKLEGNYPYSVAVAPDDKRLVVFNSANGACKLQLFDIRI